MFRRPLIIASLVGASVGVPYVISHWPDGSKDGSHPFAATGSSATIAGYPSDWGNSEPWRTAILSPGSQIHASGAPLEGVPRMPLEQVLRFDLTKEWVYHQWARKSTGLADAELFGVRVPLVTGTRVGDLAGSLTYYFNAQGQVQHITFRGQTGDTTPLVEFLTRYYAFERRVAPAGEQLYQVASRDRVHSELRTRPEPVLWSTAPHGSFAVELELERPGSDRYMLPHGPGAELPQVAVTQKLSGNYLREGDSPHFATCLVASEARTGKMGTVPDNFRTVSP